MRIYLYVAMAFLGAAEFVQADFNLRFSPQAPMVGGVAQFTLNSNNVVDLYLDADGTDFSVLQANGLLTANIGDPTNFMPPGFVLTGAGTFSSVMPSTAFDDIFSTGAVNGSGKEAAWTAAVDFFSPAATGSITTNGYSVYLGSISINPGVVLGSTGTLTLNAPIDGDITLGNGDPLSGLVGTTLNYETVAVVPEPSSTIVIGLVVGAGLVNRYRRRHKGKLALRVDSNRDADVAS